MCDILEVEFKEIDENQSFLKIIKTVVEKCFEIENLYDKNYYINFILTTPDEIQKINNEFRKINKPTDVLSFPMFDKEDIFSKPDEIREALGDIVISIERVEEQAKEYGHSFERELSYMVVHGFYHLMGYDHIEPVDKKVMREKEENVLEKLKIVR